MIYLTTFLDDGLKMYYDYDQIWYIQ